MKYTCSIATVQQNGCFFRVNSPVIYILFSLIPTWLWIKNTFFNPRQFVNGFNLSRGNLRFPTPPTSGLRRPSSSPQKFSLRRSRKPGLYSRRRWCWRPGPVPSLFIRPLFSLRLSSTRRNCYFWLIMTWKWFP